MALRDCISVQEHQRDMSAVIRSMLVLIHYDEAGGCHGVIRNMLPDGERTFRNLGELVLELDELCQELEYRKESINAAAISEEALYAGPVICADDILSVVVERRDCKTMQGRVRGKITGGRSVCFSSALALIRLLSGGRKEEQSHGS